MRRPCALIACWAAGCVVAGAIVLSGAAQPPQAAARRHAADRPAIRVREPGSLQATLDAAAPGTVVRLPAGTTYEGPVVIRRPVTLTTDGEALGDRRVDPEDRAALASIVARGNEPAIEIAPGASDVTIARLHVYGASNDLVTCGRGDSTQVTRDRQPRGVVLDQLLVEGDPVRGAKRGVTLNCADAKLTRSTIRSIFRPGQDAAAVAGWNGEGPFVIDDNFLEAASEVILFGGTDPDIPGLVPTGIDITGNVLTKDLAWRGKPYNVKNLLELKVGRRVTIRGNVMEHNWVHAQTGWAIVLTPSQYGRNPDAVIEDVLIEDNVIRHTSSGINLLGYSQHQRERPTQPTRRVTVRNNWFQLDRERWGGQGWFLQMGRSPREIVIERNTIEQNGSQFITATGEPSPGFRFVGNLVKSAGRYGIFTAGGDGRNHAHGARWREYFPGGVIEDNAIVGFARPANLPGNLHVSPSEAETAEGVGAGAVKGYGRGWSRGSP